MASKIDGKVFVKVRCISDKSLSNSWQTLVVSSSLSKIELQKEWF